MNPLIKILFGLLFILGVAAACVWIIGGKTTKHSTRLTIDATPASIFPFLTDNGRVKEWSEEIVEVGNYLNPDSESTSGNTTRIIERDGKEVEFEDKILRFDVDELLSVQSSNSFMVQTSIFQLIPGSQGKKTQLEYRVKTNHVGAGRFLAPFSKDIIEDRIVAEARKIKALVEANVDADAPQPLSSATANDSYDENVEQASFEEEVQDIESAINPSSRKFIGDANAESDDSSFNSLFGAGSQSQDGS